jgi:hypothetical protein
MVENNQGPVVVVVEYRVDANDRAEFLSAVDELGHARKRDGAYAWESMRTSPTADASSRPSRSNPGLRCCISASGRPTPTRCSAAGFANYSKRRRASRLASLPSARTGIGKSVRGTPGRERVN